MADEISLSDTEFEEKSYGSEDEDNSSHGFTVVKTDFFPKLRYMEHTPVNEIIGYFVNTHDPVNFDIDLILTTEQRERYKGVISNEYQYYEISKEGKKTSTKTGIAYRCRLRGIALVNRKHSNQKINKLLKEAHFDIIKRINKSNGWVLVTISDIDIYQRLLVDIFDPLLKEDIRTIHFDSKYSELFNQYPVDNKKKIYH